jgi:putative flippase GtrA
MALALRRIFRAVRAHSVVRAVYAYGVRTVGRRFTRFAFGSAMALAASEITLITCLGLFKLWPTVSAAVAWFAGAATSYVLSRWAWERRGRPHLLKETLPFWLIAAGTIVFLSLATSLAHHLALSIGLRPVPRLAFVAAVYLVANAVTFLSRFAIFHYVLFADRGARDSARASRASRDSSGTEVPTIPTSRATAAAVPSPPSARSRAVPAGDGLRERSTAC